MLEPQLIAKKLILLINIEILGFSFLWEPNFMNQTSGVKLLSTKEGYKVVYRRRKEERWPRAIIDRRRAEVPISHQTRESPTSRKSYEIDIRVRCVCMPTFAHLS